MDISKGVRRERRGEDWRRWRIREWRKGKGGRVNNLSVRGGKGKSAVAGEGRISDVVWRARRVEVMERGRERGEDMVTVAKVEFGLV